MDPPLLECQWCNWYLQHIQRRRPRWAVVEKEQRPCGWAPNINPSKLSARNFFHPMMLHQKLVTLTLLTKVSEISWVLLNLALDRWNIGGTLACSVCKMQSKWTDQQRSKIFPASIFATDVLRCCCPSLSGKQDHAVIVKFVSLSAVRKLCGCNKPPKSLQLSLQQPLKYWWLDFVNLPHASFALLTTRERQRNRGLNN